MVIGVTGLKRSGKDTIAQYLVSKYSFVRYAFADCMKESLSSIFMWSKDRIENEKEVVDPYWGISPRQALQVMGTEFFQFMLCEKFPEFQRETGRTIFTKRFELYYKYYLKGKENVVISDVRFLHEKEMLKKLNGLLIKVERDECVSDGHASEKDIMTMNADYLIKNNGTIEDLHKEVDMLIGAIIKREDVYK